MSDVETLLAFYQEAWQLEQEREAAFATRKKDPERWQAAKHAHAEWRSAMRALDTGRNAGVSAAVVPQTAKVASKATKTGR